MWVKKYTPRMMYLLIRTVACSYSSMKHPPTGLNQCKKNTKLYCYFYFRDALSILLHHLEICPHYMNSQLGFLLPAPTSSLIIHPLQCLMQYPVYKKHLVSTRSLQLENNRSQAILLVVASTSCGAFLDGSGSCLSWAHGVNWDQMHEWAHRSWRHHTTQYSTFGGKTPQLLKASAAAGICAYVYI